MSTPTVGHFATQERSCHGTRIRSRWAFVTIGMGIALIMVGEEGAMGNRKAERGRHDDIGVTGDAGINVSAAEEPSSGSVGLKLQLTLIGHSSRDHIVVKIEVSNTGKEAFVWDKEFSAFLKWRMTTDSLDMVRPSTIRTITQSATRNPKSRFVRVVPGRSLSKEVELTSSFRRFVYGSGVVIGDRGETQIVPNGYEELARFAIPLDAKSVGVEVEYVGVPLGESAASFTSVFGSSPLAAGLPRLAVLGDQVQIPLVANAPPARPCIGTASNDAKRCGSSDAP